MRIFLTGATGFIGSALVPELLQAGHRVLGMTRSDAGASALTEAGAEVHRGSLEHPETLAAGAAEADAVIHAAFEHDFSNFKANCEKDARAIEALGSALEGSDRPLVITSGVGFGHAGAGELASEDRFDRAHPNPRASEFAGAVLSDKGVNVSVMRLPQVHNTVKQGLITPIVEMCRAKGAVAYVGDGGNRLAAAHVSDVARLYRLAVEKGAKGARYHAVDEEGVPLRDIAAVLARGMKLPAIAIAPEDAPAFYGWLAAFVGMDLAASSASTREALGWRPSGPGLIADLERMDYSRP